MKIEILKHSKKHNKYLCKIRLCDLYNEPEIDPKFVTVIHAEILIDNNVVLQEGIVDINYVVPLNYAISV